MRFPAATALLPAALALVLLTAGCGGDDAATPVGSTPGGAAAPQATSSAAAPSKTAESSTTPGATETTPAGAATTPEVQRPAGMPPQKADQANLMERIIQDPQLTTFTTMLKRTGLSNRLAKPGPYTVFAPNNDAFAKLGGQLKLLTDPANARKLRQLISFQIVPGRYPTTSLKNGQLLTTLQGDRLRVVVKDETVSVKNGNGSAQVLVPNAQATNGLLQVTDALLLLNG
jgi:uncharacterized surface protein with fasciclin (FAS1) repeats